MGGCQRWEYGGLPLRPTQTVPRFECLPGVGSVRLPSGLSQVSEGAQDPSDPGGAVIRVVFHEAADMPGRFWLHQAASFDRELARYANALGDPQYHRNIRGHA